jgi:Protein kinase domain
VPGPGDTVGGYELLEFVNSGPTGAVYRAHDTRLGRPVALRIVAPELVDDPIVRARLNRETTALARLNHPNVPPIYDAEETDDTIIIATRWVDGARLDALVAEQGPLDPRRAVRLVTQVAAALQMAHRLGLVHRAVTPAHVLVTPEDHAYLTDFGVARRHGEAVGLTDPGALAATLDSAAPEVIRGIGVDERADVYGLGLVLYHALAGESPFARRRGAAALYAQAAADAPSLHARRPDVPVELDEVIRTALAKEPDARQPTAAEFARQAAAAIGAGAPAWASAETPQPYDAASDAVPLAAVNGHPASQRRRWRPARVLAGGLLGIFALAIFFAAATALLLLLRDTDAGPNTEKVSARAYDVAAASGRAWVATGGRGIAVLSDSGKRASRRRVLPSVRGVRELASDGRRVVAAASRSLIAVDAPGVRPTKVQLPGPASAVAAGDGADWAAIADTSTLVRVHDGTVASVSLLRPATAIAVAPKRVWVADSAHGTILGLSPTTLDAETERRSMGGRPVALAATDAAVWVVLAGSDELVRLDPYTGRVEGTPVPIPGRPTAIAADNHEVWVARAKDDAVTRIDARTGRPLDEVGTAEYPISVALTRNTVWVAGSHGELTRIPR